jgi:hypothetical protein
MTPGHLPGHGHDTLSDGTALPPGNSERIRAKFGSYGIEVLENNAELRVSSLYSTHGGVNVNRTFAVVAYPRVIEPAFSKEHDAIINGESIGIVFKQNGWLIRKDHQYFGEIETPAAHFGLAGAGGVSTLRAAIHVYSLSVKKGDAEFRYATIAEIHHPGYLCSEDLAWIYGEEYETHLEEREPITNFLAVIESRITAFTRAGP